MPTLDLRDSRWIPTRSENGVIEELGLRDALLRAHALREIRDPFPIVEFGLYRLLVALVMDIYRFVDTRDLEELLAAGRFDASHVNTYFTENADRFALFHPEYPFLQFADMKSESDKSLAGLLPPIPSGTNAGHFHHALEGEFGVCPEAAARLLTTIAPFMTAGGAGLAPSINGAPPWYALVTGDSLFQTLCLNCCVAPMTPEVEYGVPAWKRSSAFAIERRQSATLLAGLTWQPRRILLVPGAPGCCALTGRHAETLVRSMKFAPGAGAGFAWQDPNAAYRYDAKSDDKGAMILRPQEGKQAWRDVGPLALLHNESHGKDEQKTSFARPRVVDQYAEMYRGHFTKSLVPQDLRLTLYGMRTDLKMKVFEWQRESMEPLPAPLVLNTEYGTTAQREMERASQVDNGLKRALKLAYPREGKGNKQAFDSRIEYARRRFWNALRSAYRNLLYGLANADPVQIMEAKKPLSEQWKQQVRAVGERTFEEAIQDLDAEANLVLRVEVMARREFQKTLYFALSDEQAGAPSKARGKGKPNDSTKGATT